MFDIAEQLFPNLLTMIVQLCATAVIYVLYKKYVHQIVIDYIDKRRAKLTEAQTLAAEVDQRAKEQAEELAVERNKTIQEIEAQKQLMIQQVEQQKAIMLAEAKKEADQLKTDAEITINRERLAMMDEVEDYILNLAALMTQRVLENYPVDEKAMMRALQIEMSRIYETD